MSIALATRGRLWPSGGTRVIREQFVNIEVEIDDPLEISLEMQSVTEIEIEVTTDSMAVEIELVDSVTGEVIDPGTITGNTEGCY